ncbi:MAG TPA: dihydrolipoamide acetyltransferase family protein, partial [bacterium]|nr:dihydrolipoamide acetyltransferase family protein [bacterium]
MDVVMPQMGESIAEGTIVKWLKKPGDTVEKDEPLFEISTDKVDAEIPSPADGTLSEILVEEGNTVEVNTVVAKISSGGEAGGDSGGGEAGKEEAEPAPKDEAPAAGNGSEEKEPEPAAASSGSEASDGGSSGGAGDESSEPARETAPSGSAPAPSGGSGGGVATLEERLQVRSSPVVRKMAAEHDVDITQVEGTGIQGRVTKADMEKYLDQLESGAAAPTPAAQTAKAAAPAPRPAPSIPTLAGDRVEPMSVMRMKIAEHMVESRRTSAHVQTFWEVDVSHLARLRESHGEEFLRRNGVKLSFTTFFAKATCDALKEHAVVNASISGTDIHYHGSVNLGIAVALDWGLIVPVIKNAGDM